MLREGMPTCAFVFVFILGFFVWCVFLYGSFWVGYSLVLGVVFIFFLFVDVDVLLVVATCRCCLGFVLFSTRSALPLVYLFSWSSTESQDEL